jgi:hypothetical protein
MEKHQFHCRFATQCTLFINAQNTATCGVSNMWIRWGIHMPSISKGASPMNLAAFEDRWLRRALYSTDLHTVIILKLELKFCIPHILKVDLSGVGDNGLFSNAQSWWHWEVWNQVIISKIYLDQTPLSVQLVIIIRSDFLLQSIIVSRQPERWFKLYWCSAASLSHSCIKN